jgi:hypothetical protein
MVTGASRRIALIRLCWAGPAVIAASVAAVTGIQWTAIAVLPLLPPFSEEVMTSTEPQVVTIGLCSAATLVFVLCVHLARDPVRTYRRIALGALLLSFVPNVAAGLVLRPATDWPSMIALMTMHVAVWAVAAPLLTRCTASRRPQEGSDTT